MPDGSFSAAPKPETANASNSAEQKDPREVSTIAFPYHTLEDAIGLARTILEKGAVPMARDQLAAATGLKQGSGNFSNKISAARLFGLIEGAGGKSQLTRLGFDILDKSEARAKAARVQAFLNVPLYRRTYDEFRNGRLPPRPHGLEAAFISFGIAPKQKDRIRRVFDHSARLAGFFDHGDDSLVEPVIAPSSSEATPIRATEPEAVLAPDRSKAEAWKGAIGPSPSDHPFVQGLLLSLPEKLGDEWGVAERVKWLQVAATAFELMFKGGGTISIAGPTEKSEGGS